MISHAQSAAPLGAADKKPSRSHARIQSQPQPNKSHAIASPKESRKQRSDGAEARQQLLRAALALFAAKGFAKTSTREIALAAGANIAAISYYFGDKAGLYRAVFTEPTGKPCDDISRYGPDTLTLRQSLEGFIAGFLEPLKEGDLAQQISRLHFREMLEPTGMWAEQIDNHIKPAHEALVQVLSRHLGLNRSDDDVHRLAFSITGLAIQIFINRDIIEGLRPQLIATPKAIDQWAVRLADCAEALITLEQKRRHKAQLAKKNKP